MEQSVIIKCLFDCSYDFRVACAEDFDCVDCAAVDFGAFFNDCMGTFSDFLLNRVEMVKRAHLRCGIAIYLERDLDRESVPRVILFL